MIIQLLLTGSEIIAGDTVDSNSATIAQKLLPLDISIHRKVTIGDDLALLVDEIIKLSTDSDVLIINGGLGPTVDDLTAQALAIANGDLPLKLDEQALQHVQQWCEQRGTKINDANKKQAYLPQDSTLIPNPVGSAVGIKLLLNDCLILCTPGVPSEMKLMLDEQIIPMLQQEFSLRGQTHISRLLTFGFGESTVQQLIDNEHGNWPRHIELGFRAGIPLVEVKVTSHAQAHRAEHERWCDKLAEVLGAHVIARVSGSSDISLSSIVIDLLRQQGKSLTTAESCTGGLIASMITETAGASDVFSAGFVTYANDIKEKILGVPGQILEHHGAVSQRVVIAMAAGALEQSSADYAVAVSGIAGPDGGSDDKPVGTVWIAWGSANKLQSKRLRFRYNRKLFQTLVAATCLDLIRRELLGVTESPQYFFDRKA